MLQGMLFQVPNRDAVELAAYSALDRCKAMGISQSDFFFVIDVVCEEYEKQRKQNPLASMF